MDSLAAYQPVHCDTIDCCFAASARDGFAEGVIGHIARGEFEEVLVVEFALFVFFADFSPINISAVGGWCLFVFQ